MSKNMPHLFSLYGGKDKIHSEDECAYQGMDEKPYEKDFPQQSVE